MAQLGNRFHIFSKPDAAKKMAELILSQTNQNKVLP